MDSILKAFKVPFSMPTCMWGNLPSYADQPVWVYLPSCGISLCGFNWPSCGDQPIWGIWPSCGDQPMLELGRVVWISLCGVISPVVGISLFWELAQLGDQPMWVIGPVVGYQPIGGTGPGED